MGLKKIVFILILSATSLILRASKIEGAFEALSIYDYFKAKNAFYSQVTKSAKTAACYGLATIFYRSDNPFHQLDSASKYISLAGNYHKLKHLKEVYFGFTIDSLAIRGLADSIARKSLEIAQKLSSITIYEKFLTANTFASQQLRQEVFYLRDELNYKAALSHNLSDSTQKNILRFPESFFINDYFILFDKQTFEEQTNSKTIDQYVAFIKKYPKNKFVFQAQDELFEIYKKNYTIQELDFFVKNFPGSHSVNEAWKLLYAISVQSYNTSELQNFMERYPEFPFKASINKEIELNNKLLIPVNDSDFIGFIDTSGKYAILPEYEEATSFKEGLAVVTKNDSTFFINKENTNIFNAFYTDAYPFNNGFAPVNIGGKWFLINRQGQKTVGPFEELSEQSENLYVIKQAGKYGAIDVYGAFVIQAQYDKLGDFKNGMAYYVSNNLYGFISKNGLGSKAKYQWISDFDEYKSAIVKYNNFYGIINKNDSLLLPPVYDLVIKASNNTFIVVRNNKYGFFDGKGCFISGIEYDFKKELPPHYYTNGKLFKLLKSFAYGRVVKQALMDANGRITLDYDSNQEVNFAQCGLIKVKRKGKYGFLDRKLNLVIPCKYDNALDFEDSLSICDLKSESILINLKGDLIFKTKGDIEKITPGYFWVKEEEGNLLLNKKGSTLYDRIESFQLSQDGFLILEFENKTKKILKL